MELPGFTYYADPLADGTVQPSDAVCTACGQARGYITTSLLYTEDPGADDAAFCPWCIADGTAVARFGGTFNELDAGASSAATAEVEQRTPNFETWQDWSWPVHCGDAAVYLGKPAGDDLPPDAVEDLVVSGEFPREHVSDLGPDGSVTAYLFRCRACGAHLARWDSD